MNQNIIIISINRKMSIKILTSNNRIIIKENFAGMKKYEIQGVLFSCPSQKVLEKAKSPTQK